MAENGHFWCKKKKTHRSAARTPICHIVPISRVYGGGGAELHGGRLESQRSSLDA